MHGRSGLMVSVESSGREMELRPSKIICLLRSYAAHAEEMNNTVPERPRFFLKPPSSLLESGGIVRIPHGSRNVHHEVELSIVIGKRGFNIPVDVAMEHVFGYMIMLDITARDIQKEAKEKGLPWSEAKGYDTFAPVGPIIKERAEYEWKGRDIWLEVNGERRQSSKTDLLMWPIERIISDISSVMTLEEGDIIMTGTPEGVGPLAAGDRVRAGIDGLGILEIEVR